MKQIRTTYLNNKFLYSLSILSGTVVFSGKFKYKLLPKLLQIVLISIHIFILIKVTIIDIPGWDRMGSFSNSTVLLCLSKSYSYGYPLNAISAVVILSLFNKTSVSVWKEINRIDNIIEKLGFQKKLRKQNRRIWYRSSFAILEYVLQYIILLTYEWRWFEVVHHFTFFIICVSVKVQYYTFVSSIAGRFTVLNSFLKKTVNAFAPRKCNELGKKVILVIEQHKRLVALARTINKIYSFLLFSYIGFDSVILITHSYSLLNLTLHKISVEEMTYTLHIIIPNLFSAAFNLYLLASCSNVVCTEANATKGILQELTNHPQSTISTNTIKQISFHLMNNKLSITAFKLFNVDFAIIYSILATTANYLLIMLQFDLDFMKESGKRTHNTTGKL
ncbi:hypothetical protein FQA39_LY11278 [Lamprigera yunnana]|nr:hypothetical protein FQA39_LY11278 [Lamprigera yunnana]